METLLPILQLRAQLLQNPPASRPRFNSTASSIPSSPTTPVSPLSGWGAGEPYRGPGDQYRGPGDLYLNQLATINLQLQQRRLLHSPANFQDKIRIKEEGSIDNRIKEEDRGQERRIKEGQGQYRRIKEEREDERVKVERGAEQDEPIDLSSGRREKSQPQVLLLILTSSSDTLPYADSLFS